MIVGMNHTTTREARIELHQRKASEDGLKRYAATVSTETPVRRSDFGEYDEILSHGPGAVDLSRAPLPLIESHDRSKVNIGIVDNLRLDGGRLRGDVVLGKSARAQELSQDIESGIVRSLSVAYQITKMEEDNSVKPPRMTATRWAPYEVSIVSVPADPTAGIGRSAAMDGEQTQQNDQTRAQEAVRRADQELSEKIHAMVKTAKLDRSMADHLVKSGATFEAARDVVFEKLAERSGQFEIDGHTGVDNFGARTYGSGIQMGRTAQEKFIEGASAWLFQKAGNGVVQRAAAMKRPGFEKLELDPGEFRGMTMLDLAKESLERQGVRTRGLDRERIVGMALTHRSLGGNTTSDYAVLLENSLHKVLLGSYETTPDTWTRFCKTDVVQDFRSSNRYRLGSFGTLDTVSEGSEYKNKSIPDGAKFAVQAQTKGNIISLSRQAIINDDMGALADTAAKFGRAARLSIEVDVYALLAQNGGLGPTMSDSNPFFHSSHGNTNGTGSSLSVAGLESDRVIMARQTDPSGNEILDLRPYALVLPVDLGGSARVLNGAKYDTTSGTAFETPNKVYGLFNEVVDTARLTGTRRYLFADPSVAPAIVVAFLYGQQAPFLEQQLGWRIDGTEWKVRLDYGVQMGEYVGAVTNAGV